MKLRITLKDPDGISDSIVDAASKSIKQVTDLSDDEMDELFDARHELYRGIIGKWVRYGEYVTIEIDTVANTAVVVEA